MKPFNLEAALAGARVVTRDGREVTQLIKFNILNSYLSIYGVIDGILKVWTIEGFSYPYDGESKLDIFMAPSIKTVFVARYSDGCVTGGYDTLFDCQLHNPAAVDFHEIAYEE